MVVVAWHLEARIGPKEGPRVGMLWGRLLVRCLSLRQQLLQLQDLVAGDAAHLLQLVQRRFVRQNVLQHLQHFGRRLSVAEPSAGRGQVYPERLVVGARVLIELQAQRRRL